MESLEREQGLVQLKESLSMLMSSFDGNESAGPAFEGPWQQVQKRFIHWMKLRKSVKEVSEFELELEEECQGLYLALQSVSARVAESVQNELRSVREVRTKLRHRADQLAECSARAVDVQG